MKISIDCKIVPVILLFGIFQYVNSQCCQKLSPSNDKCLKCDKNMRLYKGHCLFKINNCEQYGNSVECSKCSKGYTLTVDGYCQQDIMNPPKNQQNLQYKDEQITDLATNENILILQDYGRSAYAKLQNSKIQQAFIRTFKNETKYTIINFKEGKKYFQLAAYFYEDVPFLFQIKYFQEFDKKPTANTGQAQTNNNSSNNENNSEINNNNQNNQPITRTYGEYGLNYQFLNKLSRQQNQGFASIDSLIKNAYKDQLGDNPLVLAVYTRRKNFSYQFLTFYETTDKQLIYETKSVYNAVRKQVYIIAFTQMYWRN